jgi:hypothetical protein
MRMTDFSTGRGMSLHSLYMLRQAGSIADDQLAELSAQLESAPQPSWRPLHPMLLLPAVNSRRAAAGALNISAFGLAPAAAPSAIDVPAPGIGNTPYPSFGQSTPAPSFSGLGGSDSSQLPVPPTQPPARALGMTPPMQAPPLGLAPPTGLPPTPPPAPAPASGAGPTSSSMTPWLIGGGAVLAFLFFGKQDKKRRRR